MEDNSFDIAVDAGGKHYDGWATPSAHKKEDGSPKSFHVVLNGVMFGNVSCNDTVWNVDEPRPDDLTEAVGSLLRKLIPPQAVNHKQILISRPMMFDKCLIHLLQTKPLWAT